MNILRPTIEDIHREIGNSFPRSEQMISEILNKGTLRDVYLKEIKSTLNELVRYTRGKNMKEFAKDCNKIIINYLETGELKNITELTGAFANAEKKTEKISKSNVKLVINALIKSGDCIPDTNAKDLIDKIYNELNK